MAVKRDGPGQKGTFGEPRLPVAERYVMPASRRRLLVAGVLAALVVVGIVVAELLLGQGRLLSNGPLSSGHALFAEDCSNCHFGTERTASVEKCSACHEKYGDELGVFTWSSHYLYRSDDFRRLVPSEHEEACFSCHTEHEGRDADITRVSDGHCLTCHDFGSFGRRHPQFDFAVEPSRRPAPLSFAHTHHTREVIKREELEDVERACLYCHNAEPDGRSFAAIDFDRHCDACHLTATTSTPPLPVAGGAAPGVETVDQVLARGGPGVRWAAFSNPAEFRVRGGRVIKTPVYHRDPWVLDNLRRLRQALYPDAGLADLLVASAEVPEHELRGLYEEAIDTLEEQMVGLRARPEPEVRRELARIQETLDGLRRAVREPYTPLDGTRFALAVEDPRPELTAEQVAELEGLVAQLTQPCTQCHRVEKATIARVDDDLGLLRRAEFNHRAHIVQRRCLDCHSEIPILENVATEAKLNPAVDSAEIVNLPRIETCRECHAPRRAADRCVTCHLFHPDQSRRSELLLYLE